jgi:cell division protein ZapA (FtsZ GTPase activity inhibitor)
MGDLDGAAIPQVASGHATLKNSVTLEIAGARYRMTSDTEEEHLQRLADQINARIEALGPKAQRTASPAQLLAVVALELAEDLEVAERRNERLKTVTRRAIEQAIERIDQRLDADARLAKDTDDA